MDENDKDDFYKYVNSRTFYNPHIMFIAKPYVIDNWFNTLFPWLLRCESVFGFKNLKGYETKESMLIWLSGIYLFGLKIFKHFRMALVNLRKLRKIISIILKIKNIKISSVFKRFF